MPCNAGDCRYRAELVNDVARNEVDVVVSQFEISIADALTTQLVEFSIVDPYNALHNYTHHIKTRHIMLKYTPVM